MSKVKEIKKRLEANKSHPLGAKLNEAFMEALPTMPNTAWCIDLARYALGWEVVALQSKKPELFVQNKIREKIEKDRGVKIR